MAVEWTIMIEGRNEFGDTCRKEVRIDKSWESLFDGDIGLSIDDGKKIMSALQSAVVNHEAETYSLFRRVCPDCHTFRPVKDYTARRIRTVFGTVEVRNPRWMLCRDCCPGMDGAFAPLKEICPDRATPELMELTARLGSMMPYRQAAKVLADFLPVEPTETQATVTQAHHQGSASGSTSRLCGKHGGRGLKRMIDASLRCNFPAIGAKSSLSASTPLMCAAPSPMQRETSSLSLPDAVAGDGANQVAATSSPAAPSSMRSEIVLFTLLRKSDIAASAM